MHNGWELVPFYRYTYENLQTGGFAGIDDNLPTGQGQRQFHTLGPCSFPDATSRLENRLPIRARQCAGLATRRSSARGSRFLLLRERSTHPGA